VCCSEEKFRNRWIKVSCCSPAARPPLRELGLLPRAVLDVKIRYTTTKMRVHTIIDSDARDCKRSWIWNCEAVGGTVHDMNILDGKISLSTCNDWGYQAHTFNVPDICILVKKKLKWMKHYGIWSHTPSLDAALSCRYPYPDRPATMSDDEAMIASRPAYLPSRKDLHHPTYGCFHWLGRTLEIV
jgi:hypothetical protein